MIAESLASWMLAQLRVFRTGWVSLTIVALLGFSLGLLQGAQQLRRAQLPSDGAATHFTDSIVSDSTSPTSNDALGEAYGFAPDSATADAEQFAIYEVLRGDSSWSLAEKYLGAGEKYVAIETLNGLKHNQWLAEGSWIVLPENAEMDVSNSEVIGTFTIQPEMNTEVGQQDTASSIFVLPGESLSSIAASELGASQAWHVLYALNTELIGSDPTLLRPSTVLMIPKIEYNQVAPSDSF